MLERGWCLHSSGVLNTSVTGQENLSILPVFTVPRHETAPSDTKAAEITSFSCL